MQHVAMIMDGNRRWAREKKLEAVTMGHKKGIDAIRASVRFCLKKNIKYLSLYTFSLENFRRDAKEKSYLFDLLAQSIKKDLFDLVEQKVRVRFVGDRSCFPESLRDTIFEVEEKTKEFDKLNLNFLFCYGSKQELLAATKKVAQKVKDGELSVDEIDEDIFRKEMWMGHAPDPEIIIRTGKKTRLSNFLLYQAAYSELIFPDCYWPEITQERLEECVKDFQDIQRNFGK